jgi:hypothetical protein
MDWQGRKLLVIGSNAQLQAVLETLQTVAADVHVVVRDEAARQDVAGLGSAASVHVGPADSAGFLAQWVADETLHGVLILTSAAAERVDGTDYKAGLILLRIRELERAHGLPPRHVVVETPSATDHGRLRRLNRLQHEDGPAADAGAADRRLGLVCVKDICGLLVAQAVTEPRAVEVFADIINATAGCELDWTTFEPGQGAVAFQDVAYTFATGAAGAGVPIAAQTLAETVVNPPGPYRLPADARIVYLRKVGHRAAPACEPDRGLPAARDPACATMQERETGVAAAKPPPVSKEPSR